MGTYVHDWQPQRLNGIPGSPDYDEGHAGANGHNHFGFKTREQAAAVVALLRSRNIRVTEWAGDEGAKIGGHQDPGHYDGRSFDVPASQWSPTPDSGKEIAGMRSVEEVVDGFLKGKGVPDSVLRYMRPGGSSGGQSSSSGGQAAPAPGGTTEQRTVMDDWRPAASATDRSTDPSSQAYWQRQDMRQWAQANPQLAKSAMAKAGADPGWLEGPASHTETVTVQAPAPEASASGAQAPLMPRPSDRGALNGTQVGGARPRLQPYFFEIHADAASEKGGKTGFIGSYIDKTNPLFQGIDSEYGNYGPNHSRNWRDGNLGGPRRGLSIIETRTAGAGMADANQQRSAAERLLGTLEKDPDVRSGARPLHFFAGHTDTGNPGAQGAAGGDAPEKAWNTGVMGQLRQLVQQRGYRNFSFYDGIVDDTPEAPNANWNRAAKLRQQWLQQSQGGQSQ